MAPAATALRVRLGKRLRTLRLLKAWSQETLGAEARLSYKFVGEIERGVANPTVDTLEALGEALDVDITELFGPPGDLTAINEYVLTRRESQLAREALESLEGLVQRFSLPAPDMPQAKYKQPRRSVKRR